MLLCRLLAPSSLLLSENDLSFKESRKHALFFNSGFHQWQIHPESDFSILDAGSYVTCWMTIQNFF